MATRPGFPALWLGLARQVLVGCEILSFCRDGCVEGVGVSGEAMSLNRRLKSALCVIFAYGVVVSAVHGRDAAIALVEADTCEWDP